MSYLVLIVACCASYFAGRRWTVSEVVQIFSSTNDWVLSLFARNCCISSYQRWNMKTSAHMMLRYRLIYWQST